jgi:chromosome segregation ATPase
MSITVVKKGLTDEEKETMALIVEAQRDDAIKAKIEKSEEYRKKILEQKSLIAQLENEILALTENNKELKRQVNQETTALNQLKSQVQDKRNELSALTSDYQTKQTAYSRDLRLLQSEQEQTRVATVGAENLYKKLISDCSKELEKVVCLLANKQAELKQLSFIDKHSNGYFIAKLQKIVDDKGCKVDVLKELNK